MVVLCGYSQKCAISTLMTSFAVGCTEESSPPPSCCVMLLLVGPSVAHNTAAGRLPRMDSERLPVLLMPVQASVLQDIVGGNSGFTW